MTEILVRPNDATMDQKKESPPVDFQPLVDASPQLIQKYLKLNTASGMVGTIAAYILGALIVACATLLAIRGIIEGQAIAAFLGAAIGYIFAKTGNSG